jgi:hypothetical protein
MPIDPKDIQTAMFQVASNAAEDANGMMDAESQEMLELLAEVAANPSILDDDELPAVKFFDDEAGDDDPLRVELRRSLQHFAECHHYRIAQPRCSNA